MRARGGGRLAFWLPFLWMAAFFALPFALIARMAVSRAAMAAPPFEPIFSPSDPPATWVAKLKSLSFDNFRLLFQDDLYWNAYLNSLWLAGVSTAIALLIAYPMTLAIARAPSRWKPILLTLAIAPFWTSFLVRVYAWILLLKDEGLINAALLSLGLISEPLRIYATDAAIVIGMVYSYLPFVILPLYAALDGLDGALLEAARDLGASPTRAFWRVAFPLSLPGALAGGLLMFIPAVGEFVIPDLLGGSDSLQIGRALWNDFFQNRDWPMAAAAAIALLALLAPALALYERQQMKAAPH